MTQSRRNLIRAFAAVVLTSATLPWLPRNASGSTDIGRDVARLSANSAVRSLGRRYLTKFPQEADARLLHATLFGSSRSLDKAAVMRDLAAQRVRDFTVGRVVSIDGWILARSEVQFCALAELVS